MTEIDGNRFRVPARSRFFKFSVPVSRSVPGRVLSSRSCRSLIHDKLEKIITSYIISLSDFAWQPESNLDRHGVLCETYPMSREFSTDVCHFGEDSQETGFGNFTLNSSAGKG